MTLPDPVQAAPPDAPAVVHPGGMWTYTDLDRRVAFAAQQFQQRGLQAGHQVGFWRVEPLALVVLFHAAWRLGLAVVPVGPKETAERAGALLTRTCTRVVVSSDASLSGFDRLDPDAMTEGQRTAPLPAAPWQDLPASVVFTSGSTGEPKAALHWTSHHVWSARGWAEALPLGPGDRWLLDLPLHHVGGMAVLWRCALAGACVALARPGEPLPDAAHRLGLTHASLVPTQLRRALRHPARSAESDALTRMRLLLLGGAATPPDLVAEAAARGWPVAPSYGMTEMSSTVAAVLPGSGPGALATSGQVLPHREVHLASDGEILVRGRTLFGGYLLPDGALERPSRDGGWFPTRDLGRWDLVGERRMLRVVGRKDRQFVSGGENVQPEEIERALLALPGVDEAVVVAVADAEYGHRPVAFVRGAADPAVLGAALALPSFKRPDAIYPWPEDAPPGLKPDGAWFAARAAALQGA